MREEEEKDGWLSQCVRVQRYYDTKHVVWTLWNILYIKG